MIAYEFLNDGGIKLDILKPESVLEEKNRIS